MTQFSDTITHLKNSEFLHSAPEDMVAHLAHQVHPIKLQAGETVFKRGDMGKTMYIVAEGMVRVHDDELTLKQLSRGEIFGEIAALGVESRTATVTADTDSILLRIEQDDLYDGIRKYPETARSIIQALCERGRSIINDETVYALKANQLEKELEIAHNIQRSFLPSSLPTLPGWDLEAYLKPAKEVAGDFYDFFTIPGSDHAGFVIGDVCDKGIGAALFMTLFRTLIHSTSEFQATLAPQNTRDHATLLKNSIHFTNHYVASTHGHSNMFASLVAGVIDPANGKLTYINAGHEAPVIVNTQGIQHQLEPTGPIVGMFDEAQYKVAEITINPGETLVAYTDGITEAKNSDDEFFSEPRLFSLVESTAHENGNMLQAIIDGIRDFTVNQEQYDDTTLLILHNKLEPK